MAREPGRREYYGLQVLRAAAALAVVAGHSTDYLREKTGSVPGALRWIHGPAGVDVFFVISGFVMMLTCGRLLAGPRPARTFLVRRLIRIVPLYWLLTLVKLPLVLGGWHGTHAGGASAWNIVSSFLFVPSFNASGEIRPLIAVAWTLSFEMFFYVVFALGLRVSASGLPPRHGPVRFVTGAMLGVALLGVFRAPTWPAWTALADPIVLEFLAGVWVARLTLAGRLPARWAGWCMVAAGLAGFALMVPGPQAWARPATWGVCAVLVVLGVVSLEETMGGRLPRWALAAGDASYSIYLGQSFVFPALHALVDKALAPLVATHPLAAGVVLMTLSVAAVGGVGVVLYRVVERPLTLKLRGLAGQRAPVTATP